MKWTHKLTSIALSALLLCTSANVYAYDKLYTKYSSTEALSPGVTLTREQRMTDAGWFNVNLITVDLTHPAVKSTVLIPDSISQKATLSQLASAENEIVAAINGDFFDTQGQSTLGMVVKDGDYVTSSIHDDRFYTYLQLKDGRSHIAKVLGESTKLTKPGFSLDITYKNKPYLQYDRAILFDRYWGPMSIGNENSEPVLEVVVVAGVVEGMYYNEPPREIPESGYIIAAVGARIPEIAASLRVGDAVSLTSGGFLSHIDQAIGGGAKILSEGVPVSDFSLNISGRHPRSALGFSADNNTLYLMTIDGRNTSFTGMTQTELAYLMAEFGAYNAINLDGGGSSVMLARPLGSEEPVVVNHPSDGTQRRIHNGIGIKNTAPRGPLSKLLVSFEQTRYFVQSGITPDIHGLDANDHSVQVAPDDIELSISGVEYRMDNGRIIPLESGLMTVKAQIGSISAESEIRIIGTPVELRVTPQSARLMPGQPLDIQLSGYDANGFSAPIRIEDVDILQSGISGDLVDNRYVVSEAGSGYVRFSLGEAEAFMSVGVGEATVAVHDFETQKGSFVSYPETVTGDYNLSAFSNSGNFGGTLRFDFGHDTATRAAYIDFGPDGMPLPENSNRLKLWAFGNYAGSHWLRGKVRDNAGEVHTIDFTKSINWEGWKQVEAVLPAGRTIVALERIYLVETDPAVRDTGVLVLDDLEAVVTADPPEIIQSPTVTQGAFLTITPSEVDLRISLGKGFGAEGAVLSSPEFTDVVALDNPDRFLSRKPSAAGWDRLLSYTPSPDVKETVILLSSEYGFRNVFDQKLFVDTLQRLQADYGTRVTVIHPSSADSVSIRDGIWFVGYEETEAAEIVVDFDAESPRAGKEHLIDLDLEASE